MHLGVREGMDVGHLERIHGHEALRLPSLFGGGLPLTCTGAGKVRLAFSGAELTEEVLSRPLPSLTPRSITDPARLRMALEKIQVFRASPRGAEGCPRRELHRGARVRGRHHRGGPLGGPAARTFQPGSTGPRGADGGAGAVPGPATRGLTANTAGPKRSATYWFGGSRPGLVSGSGLNTGW